MKIHLEHIVMMMKINRFFNILYLSVFIQLLVSCNGNIIKDNENEEFPKKSRVDFIYENNELMAQYLVNGKDDTTHTIIYENRKIVISEGEYISVDFTMLPKSKDVIFEVCAVDIDTLEGVFFIRKFDHSKSKYVPFFSDQLDSTYAKYVQNFDSDTTEVLLGVIYGDMNGSLFTKYLAPVKLDFTGKSITQTGRLNDSILKD